MSEHPAVVFLQQAHERAEGLARAATPGPWKSEGNDPTDDEVFTAHDGEHGDLVGYPVAYVRGGMGAPDFGRQQANMQLIALHEPAAVLRRVEAERQILTEHPPGPGLGYLDSEGVHHEGFTCHTCAPVEVMGRPQRSTWPCRTVLLLAQGWGWTEDAS